MTLKRSSNRQSEVLVVALGNPGDRFRMTRHNAGRILLDAAFPDLPWSINTFSHALEAYTVLSKSQVICIKPETFMNESGKSVLWYIKKKHIQLQDVIVLHDDIDIPIGEVKISFARGDGGHNGIKSIVEALGTKKITRIRIGISYPDHGGDRKKMLKPDVLGTFPESDRVILRRLGSHVRKQIETIISDGVDYAMSVLNGKPSVY